uniref:Abnormal spindle-like microcephaly-associated protein homolog n=1 Tax=Kryptolebias marmoratus TaxID=37003 RepID=A0A3Q3F812_KRYMA
MSFSTYTAKQKLNRLRRSACQLFTSEAMVKAIQRLELEVEARRLLVRKDRHLWKDIGERKKVLNWLLSYNPLWLRIGLETIFGELISLESNSDALGLAMFILQRLLWNPDIAAEFRHARVPHLYKDGHEEALSRFTLKKLLLLVCFLDKAKESRLIEHDPCLFCLDAEFKESKELLLAFSRDFLSGEGILPRHLSYLGLPVSHVQTPLDEFNFAVKNLAVDLKCGIRLVRVMELLVQDWSLSAKLRLPAISRLQKVHNVDIALHVLKDKGIELKDEHGTIIDSRDIVDGHREKTLSLLWKILFAFHVILNEDQLREEIFFLKRTLKTKRRLASLRADRDVPVSPAETRRPYEHTSTKIPLLMDWVCSCFSNFFFILKPVVCVQVENFTVSFSDGRVLCYLIHHYHPGLLPDGSIGVSTTQTVECSPRGQVELNCSGSDSDGSFNSSEELLENEKNNFRLVNTAVAFLGGVPAMISPADMSNTIPSEKVVMSYLSFLCARLLDLRNETRAARVVQAAWRKHKLKKNLQLYQERNKAAVKIQAAVRRFLQKRGAERQNRAAAAVIQMYYRARALSRRDRERYLLRKSSKIQKENCAARVIQAAFQKWYKEKVSERSAAAVRIQSWYRMQLCFHQYRKIKRSSVLIQAHFRGHEQRRRFQMLKLLKLQHHSAAVIQSAFRGHVVRKQLVKLRSAAVMIQRRWRASVKRDTEREMFVRLRRAAVTIQAAYRGQAARELLKKQQKAATVIQAAVRKHSAQTQYLVLRKAAAVIQQRYRSTVRARKTKKDYDDLKRAVIIVQRWLRARQQRRLYLQDRRKVITAQRAVKSWLARRHKAASIIQQAVRNFLFVRCQKRVQRGIVKAQALWRGHCSRQLNDNPKLVKLRHRLRLVSAEAREEDKLCNKTSSALEYLLQYKHLSYILEALKNLETATRLSPECCERLVESGATSVLFTLIRCCNRSIPCMNIITLSIQVLLNLSKYHKTVEAVYSVDSSVEILLDLLQRYREKAGDKVAEKGGSIFTKTCFLLALLLQDKHRAEEVKKIPKALDRLCSIYKLTARKHKLDAERNIIKLKMSASVNGSFLATPRKTRPAPKFAPDWVLTKDNLREIVDPLHAIQMVADTLAIVL